MVTQFYIIEIKRLHDGSLEHEVSWAYDEDPMAARFKGEAAFYTKVAGAALSDTDTHAVSLLAQEGQLIDRKCYHHVIDEQPVAAEGE